MLKKALLTTLAISVVALAEESDTKTQLAELPVVKCSEPVASVNILDFECKAQACQDTENPKLSPLMELLTLAGGGSVKGFGKGLANMLTTALQKTNCFKVVDLEKFEKIKKLAAATGQEVKPPKVDYMISATITAIELEKSGGSLGGGIIPILGAISKNTEKAKLSITADVIKPETLEAVLSQSFEANSEKSSWGFGAAGVGAGYGGAGGWSVSKNLSLDMVAKDVVISLTNYLAEKLAKDKIVEYPKVVKEENKEEKKEDRSRL